MHAQIHSLTFVDECCHLHVEVGNFSDSPRIYIYIFFLFIYLLNLNNVSWGKSLWCPGLKIIICKQAHGVSQRLLFMMWLKGCWTDGRIWTMLQTYLIQKLKNEMTRITWLSVMKVTKTTRFVLLYYIDIAHICTNFHDRAVDTYFSVYFSSKFQNHKFKVS